MHSYYPEFEHSTNMLNVKMKYKVILGQLE